MSPNADGTTVFLLLAFAMGCNESSNASPAIVVDTLLNGTIHVSNPDPALLPDLPHWTIEEELRIGSVDGEDAYVFGRIKDIAVDSEGRLFVLELATNEVRIFNSTGTHLRSMGRRGSGPTEFRHVHGLAWSPAGNLWVMDIGNNRFAAFGSDGTHREVRLRQHGTFYREWIGGVDSLGGVRDMVTHALSRKSCHNCAYQLHKANYLKLHNPRAEATDSALIFDYGPVTFLDLPRGSALMPFEQRLVCEFDNRGYMWFVTTPDYTIFQTNLAGDTLRRIESRRPPNPVTDRDREIAIARMERHMQRTGRMEIDWSLMPDTKPAIHDLMIDDVGRLWVQRETDDSTTSFDVFSDEGYLVATASADFPISWWPEVQVSGNRLYAIVTDEFDVQYVLQARIGS